MIQKTVHIFISTCNFPLSSDLLCPGGYIKLYTETWGWYLEATLQNVFSSRWNCFNKTTAEVSGFCLTVSRCLFRKPLGGECRQTINWCNNDNVRWHVYNSPVLTGTWLTAKLYLIIRQVTAAYLNYNHRGLLLLAWISSFIHYKVWCEINDPFPNFNGTWAIPFHTLVGAWLPIQPENEVNPC